MHTEDGVIQTVNREKRIKVCEKEKVVSMLMVSYLNIGVHARIDLGFDLKKSNESAAKNRWIKGF